MQYLLFTGHTFYKWNWNFHYGQCEDLNGFFFSSLSSNSKGVAILFNDNFELKILNEAKDINGNYLILDVIVEKERLILVS